LIATFSYFENRSLETNKRIKKQRLLRAGQCQGVYSAILDYSLRTDVRRMFDDTRNMAS